MTDFERNARRSYDEKLAYLQTQYQYPNLQTMSYRGFDVITTSKLGKGFTCYFYKDGQLVKMRNKVWKNVISDYVKNYIDQILIKMEL